MPHHNRPNCNEEPQLIVEKHNETSDDQAKPINFLRLANMRVRNHRRNFYQHKKRKKEKKKTIRVIRQKMRWKGRNKLSSWECTMQLWALSNYCSLHSHQHAHASHRLPLCKPSKLDLCVQERANFFAHHLDHDDVAAAAAAANARVCKVLYSVFGYSPFDQLLISSLWCNYNNLPKSIFSIVTPDRGYLLA